MAEVFSAIGLMSGTSMDGIDVAHIETDGRDVVHVRAHGGRPYDDGERALLAAAMASASGLTDRNVRPGPLTDAEAMVTDRHGDVVEEFMSQHGLAPGDVDVVGFHGQTVLHRPDIGLTMQLGDGPALARRLGVKVVYDLRANDMAGGGGGAPFAPVYHRACAARSPTRPLAFVNIGGVSNVTWIGQDGDLMAFDCGPGNALINDWVSQISGAACDEGGQLARTGIVDEIVLGQLLSHPYFDAKPPKSLDRNDFDIAPVKSLSPADGAATLTAFTAAAIARSGVLLPNRVEQWVICGGGRHNSALMAELRNRLDGDVVAAEALGLNGDMLEAEAFAYLAVRSLKGLPISFPTTTGVEEARTGGVLCVP